MGTITSTTLPARLKAAIAAERSMPKMHWRWRRRGRDIVALLQSRFGSALPDDDAGVDAAKLLALHYVRLNIDAERVTRANLRLWASWLTEKEIAGLIADGARKAKPPSAAQLGKHWRVTADEVVDLGLTTITAFTVTLETDRIRQQARRRRNAGAAKNRGRGRPKSEGSAPWQLAGTSRRTWFRRRNVGTETGTEIRHASAYYREMKRDGIKVPKASLTPWAALGMSRATYFRHKAAGTLPMPAAIIASAINLDMDFSKFGITGITLMKGTDILRTWNRIT